MNIKQELRYAAADVAAQYYTHNQSGIETLTPFIAWVENHLIGIPFSTEWNPTISGDYDPRRPAFFLSDMYKSYQIVGEQDQSDDIRKSIESPELNPSKALSILREKWSFYSGFDTMNRCVEYCILCAKEFPDTLEAREAFHDALNQIQIPID